MGWIKEQLIPIMILTGLGLGMGAVGYGHHKGYNQTYSYDNGAKQSIERTPPALSFTESKQAPSTDQSVSKEEWETRDHKAQIGMFWAAWAAVVLTGLGLLLICFTLLYTRNAAILTREVLDTTKDTSYKELRAYLGVALTAAPVKHGDKKLAVNVTIKNLGQTPAYNIRFVHALHDSSIMWGPDDMPTTAILNPTEDVSPQFVSKFKQVEKVREIKTIYFLLDVIFIDMNHKERWLKFIFSKPGSEWPFEVQGIRAPRIDGKRRPVRFEEIEGTTGMNMSKMETGDLTDQPYKM